MLSVVKFYCGNSYFRPKDVFLVKAEGSNEQRAFGIYQYTKLSSLTLLAEVNTFCK